MLKEHDRQVLESLSRREMTALEARRLLQNASYGDLLRMLGEAGLPLPRAPIAGREEQIKCARDWMFPARAA